MSQFHKKWPLPMGQVDSNVKEINNRFGIIARAKESTIIKQQLDKNRYI